MCYLYYLNFARPILGLIPAISTPRVLFSIAFPTDLFQANCAQGLLLLSLLSKLGLETSSFCAETPASAPLAGYSYPEFVFSKRHSLP